MRVTVYDRVPATAEISVRQLEEILALRGWKPAEVHETIDGALVGCKDWFRGVDRYENPITTTANMPAGCVALVVEAIARELGVQPSAVLADIAKETA